MLKILFVGSSAYPMYVTAFFNATKEIDYVEGRLFDIDTYIKKESFTHRVEQNIALGPMISKLNKDLLQVCSDKNYDIVFLYTSRVVYPKSIKKIKEAGSYIALYNNDNPFSKAFKSYFWRHYRKSIKYSDITYVYRNSNFEDAKQYGAKKIKLLRSYYIKELNYYISESNEFLECPEVVFLGHLEEDERIDYIKALTEKRISVGVPEKGWSEIDKNNEYLIRLKNTHRDYNLILNKCKIAVVFLSKINEDTYTRRCFEIPATKTLMVAPYTDDLATLYVDGEEIIFFKNKDEFVDKISYYLANKGKRVDVAENGYDRVISDGHEAKDRVLSVINDYNEMR